VAKIHPFSIKFSKRLKQERLKRNMSQERLGFKAGVSRNFISMIERGERNLTITKLHDIAKALELEAWELLRN